MLDDLKIKGNKEYDQGNYYQALEIYELVIGCYTWLSFTNPDLKEQIYSKYDFQGIRDEDVDLNMKQIINEEDREFETDTSKINF